MTVIVYLSFNFPYDKLARSADWHVLMVFFGLFSLAFYLRRRFLLSGLAASLSVLSWQPGIIFILTIVLVVLLFSQGGKTKKISWILSFFILPVGITIIYVYFRGSLSEMIEQTILYGRINVGDGFLEGIKVIPARIRISYYKNIPILLLGVLGFAVNWIKVLRGGKLVLERYFFPLILLSMILIFSLVDFQSSRDVIPALPWISFYAVFLIDLAPSPARWYC